VNKYFASEIDEHAIKVTQHNFPNTIQLGDVTKINAENLPKIDLIIGGSPCQGFSFAGKQLNFDDPRSKLFFEFVRLKNELNPTYFLLENVRMKKEYKDVISEYLGVEPIEINSSNFVAQNRPRLYWANFKIEKPKEKSYQLKDFLLDDNDERIEKFKLSEKAIEYMNRLRNGKPRWNYHTNPLNGNAACLTANMYKGIPYGVIKEKLRKLTPVECERLQGVPDNYTNVVSNTQRLRMLGNGWTVNVIEYIFRNI
jgi:DNA-cytosine methyltransferase